MFFSNAKRDGRVRRLALRGRGAGIFIAAVLAAACGDGPTTFLAGDAPEFEKPVGMTGFVQEIRCRVSVADSPGMSCGAVDAGGAGGEAAIIVGGQGVYVLMESDAPLAAGEFVMVPNVRITNLMALPLGTPDYEQVTGIRVFFQHGPSNGASVLTDSTATFLAANQKYYRYHEMLNAGETSGGLVWVFQLGGATSFEFGVLIQADQPPPEAMAWVHVGDPNNLPDSEVFMSCLLATCGSVPYEYLISKYLVTNAQYAAFLNAKAVASDPLGLYNTQMAIADGGIIRNGAPGSYTYSVREGFARKPVVAVSVYDAMRFANWVHNGGGDGDTEDGAYTLLGGTATPSNWNSVERNAGARVFLPTEDEWYKAAYYDPAREAYNDFPAGRDEMVTCAPPGPTPNTANCAGVVGGPTDVGAYTGSPSPYGTFDQGGNVLEWTETHAGDFQIARGGNWYMLADGTAGPSTWFPPPEPTVEATIGFRLAASAE